MADQLDEIRSKIDIVQLINEYIPLKKSGRNFKALCPFHSEKVPSFMASPERQIFKCFGCFPAGTKIKTPGGLHPIDQIKKHDFVISGKGKPKKVIFTHKRDYRGKIVKVLLWKLGGAVILTEDHKVFIVDGAPYTRQYKNFSRRFRKYGILDQEKYNQKLQRYFPIKKIPAGNLKVGDRLLYPVDREEKDLKEIDLKEFITKTLPPHGTKPRKILYQIPVKKDFLKLLGYWIAEGSNNRAYIRFSLGSHEENFAKEIQKLIKKLFGLEAKIHWRKGARTGLELTCCHSFLANIFENLCGNGAENKHTPFIFQHLPPKKQEVILKAILRGDGFTFRGSKSRHYYHVITTVSPILAEQLRDIILRLGYFPTEVVERSRVDRKGVTHKKAYRISWSVQAKSRYSLTYKEPDGTKYWMLPVRKLEKQLFKGSVYNLTLESDNSYIARNFVVANCGKGGDVFRFLMEYEKMDFGEALRVLAKRAGIKLRPYKPSESEAEKGKLYEINHLASEFYHYLLVNHPVGKKALNYTLGRGINKDSLQLFKLGYAPSLGNGLQKYLVDKKGYQLKELEGAGLILKTGNQYRDFFRERVLFPLKDHRDNVLGFSGRVIGAWRDEMAEKIGPKYINTPETLVYHKGNILYGMETTRKAIKEKNQAIIVEGEFDLISSFQVGVENVVAIKGSALTEAQARLLRRFCENIVFALDRDIAGDAASRRGIEIADQAGLNIMVVKMEEGKDPDELAQKNPEAWRQAVASAVPIYDFLIDSSLSRFDSKTAVGKKKIGQELVPILAKISDEIVKAHYVRFLSQKLGVTEESIFTQLSKVEEEAEVIPKKEIVAGRSHREVLEEYLLALILQGEETERLLKRKVANLFKTPANLRIVKLVKEFLSQKKKKEFSSEKFVKKLPPELLEIFNGFYLKDLGKKIEDQEWRKKEIEKTILGLEEIDVRTKLKELSAQMAILEKEGKTRELEKKKKEFRELSKTLSSLGKG